MFEEETERSLWKRRQNLREQVFGKMQVKKPWNFRIKRFPLKLHFHFSSNFGCFIFSLGVFIWHSGQSIECKGQCPCPVCDCSKPRTVCQTNGNSFPGVKCYDPCRLYIVFHVLESATYTNPTNKPTNRETEWDYVNRHNKIKTLVIRFIC